MAQSPKIQKATCPECGEKNILAHNWEEATRTARGTKTQEIWFFYTCPECDHTWSVQKIKG